MKRNILAVALILVLTATTLTAFAQNKKPAEKAKDPVCGMMVDKDPELSASHKGETHYFCSKADLEKFKKEPDKYVKKK